MTRASVPLQALFMDRLYNRKAVEANERFKNNLEALNVAKDILIANRQTIIVPGYVTTAIDGGMLDNRSVDWARGQVAIAIRRYPALCGPSPERASPGRGSSSARRRPNRGWPSRCLRFAYDNPFEKEIAALCLRLLGSDQRGQGVDPSAPSM